MISHALTIIANETQRHFSDAYGVPATPSVIQLGNIAEGVGATGVPRDVLCLGVVNLREEHTLKNLPTFVRDDAAQRISYENPPLFLNLTTLFAATHTNYSNALLVLSRGLRFIQSGNVFTQDSVHADSITKDAPSNPLDRLIAFKLILDLYSPTLEETNHLWGTLGGKQYPFALFNLRLVKLKFRDVQAEAGVITEVLRNYRHVSGDRRT